MNVQNRSFAAAENSSSDSGVEEITPVEAWERVSAGDAKLLDVRTLKERVYVGRVPETAHVAWATGTAMTRNPHFVRQVAAAFPKDTPLILLCRSGKRSRAAGEALIKAGFTRIANISEGFEGDMDGTGRRGSVGGWRLRGLPWEQD